MNAPRSIGDLALVGVYMDLYTYRAPDGTAYVLTGKQLASWGNKVSKLTVVRHSQKTIAGGRR